MTITAYASATMANNSSSSHVTQQQQRQRQRTTRQQQRQRLRQSRARTKSAAQITLTSTSTLTPLLKRAISAPQWIFLFILIFAATGKDVCVLVSQDTWDINVVEIESERERWNCRKQQQTRSAQVFRWAHYIFYAFWIMFVYLCTCTTIVSEYEQHRPKYSTYAWIIDVYVYIYAKRGHY